MAEKQELTPEQKAEAMKKSREVAMKNLKSGHLLDLASAYFVDSSGAYGEAPNAALEMYKYFPALGDAKAYDPKTGEEINIIQNSLLGSRAGNKRYSGNLSEYGIIEQCGTIAMQSLGAVTVNDALSLMGSSTNLAEGLGDKYVGELDKKQLQAVLGSYQNFLMNSKVSEALSESAKDSVKGLEKILTTPEKPRAE